MVQMLAVVALVCVWFVIAATVAASGLRNPDGVFPSPLATVLAFSDFGQFGSSGESAVAVLALNVLVSAIRLALGLVIGSVAGFCLGLLVSWSTILRQIIEPPLLAVRTIPIFALVPLFLTWFGGNDVGVVSFIAFAVFSMVVVNTIEAVKNVPSSLLLYGETTGSRGLHTYRTIVIPSIVPELVGAGRVVIGIAWAVLLAGEFIGAQTGIGHMLIQARQFNNTSLMMLVVVFIAIFTWLMDALFSTLGHRATAWLPSTSQ